MGTLKLDPFDAVMVTVQQVQTGSTDDPTRLDPRRRAAQARQALANAEATIAARSADKAATPVQPEPDQTENAADPASSALTPPIGWIDAPPTAQQPPVKPADDSASSALTPAVGWMDAAPAVRTPAEAQLNQNPTTRHTPAEAQPAHLTTAQSEPTQRTPAAARSTIVPGTNTALYGDPPDAPQHQRLQPRSRVTESLVPHVGARIAAAAVLLILVLLATWWLPALFG